MAMALRILIVEGNPGEALDAADAAGRMRAHEAYRRSLVLHAPDAEFATLFALAPDRGPVPPDLCVFDGIALTGSGVPWSAGAPQARPYLDLLGKLFDSGKPVVGSCWGLQAAAVLFGGAVAPNPKGYEVGVARDIELTPEGRAHWGFAGMPPVFDQPTIHRDHVTRLPAGALHLARNDICEIQAFSYRHGAVDFLGTEAHPELELSLVRAMFENRARPPGTTIVHADFPDKPSRHVADPVERTRMFANWLDHVRRIKAERENPEAVPGVGG